MATDSEASRPEGWNPSGSAAAAPRRGLPRWRLEPRRPGRRRAALRTLATALCYLSLSGLLIWVVLWLSPPQPARLVLLGAGYETNLAIPENVYGREALRDLEALTRRSPLSLFWKSRRMVLPHPARTLRSHGGWDRDLGSGPEKTLVLYVAVHGGTDAKGAYLLADDGDARNLEGSRLRLDAVLDRLADRSLEKKNKALILDVTRLSTHWPLGMIRNDFARELRRLDERISQIPRLIVISASDVDQRSGDSGQWRRTAFAHFLVQGLKGEAARQDGRIDVRSLFEFVRGRVGLWARAARGTVQTPVLLPSRGGVERAAEMELAAVPLRPSAEPAAEPPSELSADLVSAWREFGRLQRQEPYPAAYAPETWSLLQATILRAEELERAGDRGSARALLPRLAELQRALDESRTIALPLSTAASLAMPAACGQRLPAASEAVEQQFNRHWDAPTAELPKRWGQILQSLAATASEARTQVRLQVTRLVLDRVAESPEQDLARGVSWLRAIDPPTEPRPAEAHDLIMLRRSGDAPDRPGEAYFGAVARAVRTRLGAEAAALGLGANGHPYSERVAPWVWQKVAQGDELRRPGHDLLFAADERSWNEAIRLLDGASARYAEAGEQAGKLREKLAVRDRILPTLPYYTRWLVQNRPGDGQLQQQAEALWDRLHESLGRLQPSPKNLAGPSPADDSAAASLGQGYGQIEREFARACESALAASEPDNLAAILEALKVPFLDLPEEAKSGLTRLSQVDISQRSNDARVKLLAHAARLEESLHSRYAKVLEDGDSSPAPSQEDLGAKGIQRARSGVRLALATIGRSWYDEGPELESEPFDQARQRSLAIDPQEEPAWLARVGGRIGERLASTAEEIVRLVERPRLRAQVGDGLARLARADTMRQLLDGSAADLLARHLLPRHDPRALATPIDRVQLSAYRRLLIRSLLAHQARRAYDDHWYAEDPQARTPYYRAVGQAYLDDAKALDPFQFAPDGSLADLEQSLAQSPDGLQISGPAERSVTDEPTLDFRYSVRPDRTRRTGHAVLWSEVPAPFRAADRAAGRMAVALGESEPGLDFRLEQPIAEDPAQDRRPPRGSVDFAVRGLFRGQRLARVTRLDIFPRPEEVAGHHPPSGPARVAVRAGDDVFQKFGSGNGVLAIVLDASGSMGPPRGEGFTDATRFSQATRALEQVLREQPAGTIVGIYTFGAAPPDRRDVRPEDTIRTAIPLTRWDPSMLEGVMSQLRFPATLPWSESPIVRTVLAARDDLLGLGGASGQKSILVITDGDDNRFAQDKIGNPTGKGVRDALQEGFRDTGIQLNVVGFRPASRVEQERMASQFGVVSDLQVPGRFYYVDNLEQLVASLRRATRRELAYRVVGEDENPVPGISPREVLISRPSANIRWFPEGLPPGGYKLAAVVDRLRTKSIALDHGDLLLVNLLDGDRPISFERVLYAKEFYPFAPSAFDARNRWRLTVLRNRRMPGGAVQMLVALERQPDPGESILRVIRPKEIWFEVATGAETPRPVSLRWSEREGFPAPTWALELPDWPAAQAGGSQAASVLRAWWRDAADAPPVRILRAIEDFPVGPGPHPEQKLTAGRSTFTLESIGIEDHVVEVADQARQARPCLVVRMAYQGQPIRVRPDHVSFVGAEHRCYLEAGRYTGIFWTTTRDEIPDLPKLRLEVIGREDFRTQCRNDGTSVELVLDAPGTEETLPLSAEPLPDGPAR
jgi:hypothetical protein